MSLKGVVEKFIGTYSDRELKRVTPIADKVMAFEAEMERKSDAELRAMTFEFKARLEKGETLDDILPEAFAVCREASWRALGMKHFYVQVIGGIVLHQGRIAEMKTGEGKTLVATLPAYLNALSGKGVHVVTVNDYLAKRDSEWMGKVYTFLGLTVGLIIHDIKPDERQAAYNADITYGTNNEMGFDYLRDNMVIYKEHKVQRGHSYAIVDEVDSILVDEARTPLIISGRGDKPNVLYEQADRFAKTLKVKKVAETDAKVDDEEAYADFDYVVDEKARSATLTPRGVKKAESTFNVENLTDPDNLAISHHINQAIRANGLMKRDVDYVVKDGEIVIVDEFTGRMMFGRRYSDGLHQAIEAKEKVKVENESRTLATITFQNYFRLYDKLSGMTGTAQTEEDEFQEIYKLDVIVIPTNKPLVRQDLPDVIYKNETAKFNAVIDEVVEAHANGQPVLIGTISIEKSEQLSGMLKRRGIKHEVLNAKFHDKEAEIVAQAGKSGAVTIATNMAGRGTDIVLGGNAEFMAKREMSKLGFSDELINLANGFAETDDQEILAARAKFHELEKKYKSENAPDAEKVLAAGGLCIMGTERHESRRIDNQLRGRAGRQGDNGRSRFFLSLDDDLMRLFGSDKIANVMNMLGVEENEPIESKMVSNAIETAQKRVENRNFDIRKHVLQYDDVNNEQREMIYKQRNLVLEGENLRDKIINMAGSVVDRAIEVYTGESQYAEEWDLAGMRENLQAAFMPFEAEEMQYSGHELDYMKRDWLRDNVMEIVERQYLIKEEQFGENIREVERVVLLQMVDQKWMAHIDAMEQFRQGINLRAYAQRDPIVEYKFEGQAMFDEMTYEIKSDTVKLIFRAQPQGEIERKSVATPLAARQAAFNFGGAPSGKAVAKTPVVKAEKVGRNEQCTCGSGKKYKKCCGLEE